MSDVDPLILTLALDAESQTRFDALRQAHFPPALNRIAAHVTMFHHLPGDALDEVAARLDEIAAVTPRFDVAVTNLRLLGRGVAFDLASLTAAAVRRRVADAFADHLTPQDRQGWRPHVTIQNKVDPTEARAVLEDLGAQFVPYSVRAEGLKLWRYRGGPWEPAADVPFQA